MPLLADGTIATKARGVRVCQHLLWRMSTGLFPVERITIGPFGNLYVHGRDGETLPLGFLHEKWLPLVSQGLEITSWQITGGRPTGITSRKGELLEYFGLNFTARYATNEQQTRNTAGVGEEVRMGHYRSRHARPLVEAAVLQD